MLDVICAECVRAQAETSREMRRKQRDREGKSLEKRFIDNLRTSRKMVVIFGS